MVLRAGAERFMGKEQAQAVGFSILYRAFDHGRMKKTCEMLQASTLNRKYQDHLGTSAVSKPMRDFANTFIALQDVRHLADYDPVIRFLPSDVSPLIAAAEAAMEAFAGVSSDERTGVLALMMVGVRG
jgi:hypothetical protein